MRRTSATAVLCLAGAMVYPIFFADPYFLHMAILMGIYALLAVSLNLLLGYTGLLSFGHAMFFGTGGYATALLLTHVKGVPLVMAVLTGFLAAALLALLLSLLLVRASKAPSSSRSVRKPLNRLTTTAILKPLACSFPW